MALPELNPNVALNPNEESKKPEMKVTWLQHMLDEQKKIVQDSPSDKPQKASPAEQLAFVSKQFDTILSAYESPKQEIVKPQEPEYLSSITWGLEGKPLESSPISGSILKLLMNEPGMKEKIDAGIKTGHQYSIVHQPGQTSFFLWDKWNETDKGITSNKKRVTAFVIKNPEDIKPAEPKKAGVPLPSDKDFMKIPMIPEEEVPVVTLDAKPNAPFPPEMKDLTTEPAPNAHWNLMRAKFSNQAFNAKSPSGQGRFQRTEDAKAMPDFVKDIKSYDQEQKQVKPLEKLLGETLEGNLLKEWNIAKTMRTNSFLYPEKYNWEGPNGQPIQRTLENYPPVFRKLRDILVGITGTLQKMNPQLNFEIMPLGEAFDEFVDEGLL